MEYLFRWRFVYASVGIGMFVPLIHCYECGSVISDQAMACPKCGAPKPTEPIDSGKFFDLLNITSFSLFTTGIVLLAIAGFSYSWLVIDLPSEIDGIEMQFGLTHVAIDCSDIDDSDERNICKLSANIFLSGQDPETYLENSTIESEDDLQKLGEDLPEKQAILFADICQLESFSSADSEECEEAVEAGYVAASFGIASIMLGATSILIALISRILFKIKESSSTATTLAFCSTILSLFGFFAWIILLPEDMFDDLDTGWAFGLAIGGLSTMTFSILLMLGEYIGLKISKPNLGY